MTDLVERENYPGELGATKLNKKPPAVKTPKQRIGIHKKKPL